MITVRCPICDRAIADKGAAERDYLPFCSRRCRLIDLGRWLGEAYRIEPESKGEAPASFDDDLDIP